MASLVGAELQCEIENHFLPEGVDDFCLPICSSVLRTWLRVVIRTGDLMYQEVGFPWVMDSCKRQADANPAIKMFI